MIDQGLFSCSCFDFHHFPKASILPFILIVHSRLERDDKLGALEERADALQDGAAQFEKQAASMKNKFWLENMKSMVAMGVVGLLVLGLIYWKFMAPAPQQPPPYAYAPPPQQPPPQQPAPSAGGGGESSESSSSGEEARRKFISHLFMT